MKNFAAIATLALLLSFAQYTIAQQIPRPAESTGASAERVAEMAAFFREYSAAMLELKQTQSDPERAAFYEGVATMAYYAANVVENVNPPPLPKSIFDPKHRKAGNQLGTRSTLKPVPPLSAAP
jgi:hypothetical protein